MIMHQIALSPIRNPQLPEAKSVCRETWRATTSDHAGTGGIQVLFASSEVTPLAKTGGLADVSAALPATLAALGVDIRLVIPGYEQALGLAKHKQTPIPLGSICGIGGAAIVPARTPDSALPVWIVDCPTLFRRPGGLYLDEQGDDWPDNALRFAFFSHVVARLALGTAGTGWRPDIVHVHHWHVALVPALVALKPEHPVGSLLTIHNLAFQGLFPAEIFPSLGLPDRLFRPDGAEFYVRYSFLKAGIQFADRISTVTRRYAQEIMWPEFERSALRYLSIFADLIGVRGEADALPRHNHTHDRRVLTGTRA